MRVFDCFTFYNELDIAELRIQELWDVVDFFVIAEANTTHQNNSKPFYLKDNWARFEPYKEKIRHIMIEDMPCDKDTWVNERYQRFSLSRGLTDLQPNDIVIVSDCDEIPRPAAIAAIKEDTNDYDRYILAIPLNYYKFNYMMVTPVHKQNNIMVTRGRVFTDPQNERARTFHTGNLPPHYADDHLCILEHAGWHFTYFGQTDFAKNKIANFAHNETAGLVAEKIGSMDNLNIDWMIENKVGLGGFNGNKRFEYIQIDEYFPKTILDNLDKWQHMIVPNATKSVYSYYPE
jgi:hypothetical protein